MITEDYCSFEVAKLLKEKGFDKFSYYGWDEQLFDKEHPRNFSIGIDDKKQWISCHTHQMAMKWLREVHLLHVYAEHKCFFQERPKKLYYHWMPFVKPLPQCKYQTPLNKVYYELDMYCNSYEDAIEKSIKYCLENLI